MAEPAKPATGPATPDGLDELILPMGVPTNIQSEGRYRVEHITADLYNISNRLREEVGPEFFILIREDRKFGTKAFTVMRHIEGGEEFVFNCRTLDARVIEHVKYLIKIPLEQRFQEACRIIDKQEAEAKDEEMNQLVENLGLPMVKDLLECGFIEQRGGFAHAPKNFGKGA